MKKMIVILAFTTILFANKNTKVNNIYLIKNNDINSKISIGAKYDNLAIEAIYSKKLTGEEKDLSSYFKSGNSLGLNFTYTIDSNNTNGNQTKFSIIDLTNQDKKFIQNIETYKLKNKEKAQKLLNNIESINSNSNIKFKVKNIEIKPEKQAILKILRINAKQITKKYGEIDKKNLEEIISKNNKIVINFDGGANGK